MRLKPTEFFTRPAALLVLFCSLFVSTFAFAAAPKVYTFEFKNVSHGMTFTPPIFALCPRGFAPPAQVGEPPSTALEELAEGGTTGSLATLFEDGGCSVNEHGAGVGPGQTIDVELSGRRRDKLYVLSMALPTDDAFVSGPGKSVMELRRLGWVGLEAYDAGTEKNTELCSDIPADQCDGTANGEGFNAVRDDVVDYVHPHGGIKGGGDLLPANFDLTEQVGLVRRVLP